VYVCNATILPSVNDVESKFKFMFWGTLDPQELLAETFNVPLVAFEEKSIVIEFPLPIIVAPVPLNVHEYWAPFTEGTLNATPVWPFKTVVEAVTIATGCAG